MSQEQTTELAAIDPPAELQAQAAQSLVQPFTVEALVDRVKLVKEAMQRCMVEGQHYGTVPGTKKPSLWKPGAELLGVLFQLGQRYRVQERLLEGGHIVYTVTCTQFFRPTGADVSEGVGCCTTMEYKYRVQTEPRTSENGKTVPSKYTPFDFYNTALKMAAKRALVAATINATGSSEMWTQDTEDNPDLYRDEEQPKRQPLPKAPSRPANGDG